ncbi:RNase III inhibitor [Frondihabitans sp. PAMC 28766]|uniref:O-acetyl-ADP-ribose deacetylase n=1 Tax=Frondihabitans sp. PAMC 28766 TaxID=1795630 RepID=UPI00078C86C1|nr:O-acetyl-ADP-ribose deacetylase [Frondihabitans sp. PAMC 28766]AMM19312.1 RNase III inhibitor [Frondihabitans sp. PAMC 28766]
MSELLAWQGDITKYPADVIVNAANSSLLGGGGVDGAIHRAAGPQLLAECRTLGGAHTGEAKLTGAYGITTAQHIVHTVGPVYQQHSPGRAAELLASCYRASLDLADGAGAGSIAFPAISTGVYGYPLQDATRVAVATIHTWRGEHTGSPLQRVTLVAYSASDFAVLQHAVADAATPETSP